MTTKHGHIWREEGKKVKSETYTSWQNMKARCNNPNHTVYSRYGGVGIKVCPSWEASFETFLADMGEKPPGYTLDRIDNEVGYSKENCRWATYSQQAQNRGGWDKSKAALGVGFDRRNNKWRARIKRDGVAHFIGHFNTEAEAIEAKLRFIEENGL